MFSKFKSFSKYSTLQNFNKILSKNINNQNPLNNTSSSARSSYLKYILLGLGIGGLSYVSYQGGLARDEHLRNALYNGSRVNQRIVIQRTKDTLAYFGAGLTLTSLLTMGMMRSPFFMNMYAKMSMRPYMLLFLTLPSMMICIYGMKKPAIPQNTAVKHISWFAFNSIMSFTIAPLVLMSGPQLAMQACLLTAGAVGGLAYTAYLSKNDAFLGLNGFLAAGSGVMMACAIASFFTNSALINNIWLYGGLGLFLAYVLYDVNQIKIKAERLPYFDPMGESIHIYMDTINIFVRILMILNNKKNK
jgi:FtsH-binding integral membrane protein